MYLQGSFMFGGFNKGKDKDNKDSSFLLGSQEGFSIDHVKVSSINGKNATNATNAATTTTTTTKDAEVDATATVKSDSDSGSGSGSVMNDIVNVMFQRGYLPPNLRLFAWQKNLLVSSYNTIINHLYYKLVESCSLDTSISSTTASTTTISTTASTTPNLTNTKTTSSAYNHSNLKISYEDLKKKITKITNLLTTRYSRRIKPCDILDSVELSKILAWPTGLGKTLASLAHVALVRMILDDLHATSHELKVLIIAPTGSHPVWIKEAKKIDLFHHNILTVDPNLKLRHLMFAELGLGLEESQEGVDDHVDHIPSGNNNSNDIVIGHGNSNGNCSDNSKEIFQQELNALLIEEQEQEQESCGNSSVTPSATPSDTHSHTITTCTTAGVSAVSGVSDDLVDRKRPRVTALLITSNMLLRLISRLKTVTWDVVIRDEAHDDRCLIKCGVENLRSKDSKIAHAIYSLNHRCKLALSATLYFNTIWDVISQICMLKWTPPERRKLGENWGDIHFWKAVQPKSRLQAIVHLALKCCTSQERNLWQESKLSKMSVVHKNILVQADQEQNLILLLLLRRIKAFQSNHQFCVIWKQLFDEVQATRQVIRQANRCRNVSQVKVKEISDISGAQLESKKNNLINSKTLNFTRIYSSQSLQLLHSLLLNTKTRTISTTRSKSKSKIKALQNTIDLSEMSLDDELNEECEKESQSKLQQHNNTMQHNEHNEHSMPNDLTTLSLTSLTTLSTLSTPSLPSTSTSTSTSTSSSTEIKLFGLWSHLQRLSLHPRLVKLQKDEELFLDNNNNNNNNNDNHHYDYIQQTISSPKLLTLVESILKILYEKKERVVVCSSSVKALTYYKEYMEAVLAEKEVEAKEAKEAKRSVVPVVQLPRCCLYTGHETKESRANLLKRISTKNAGGVDVLFLCRAVAQSVPMTFFNHLFYTDVHPNAAQETQAFGRLARIGQQHNTLNTYQLILTFPFINKLKPLISPTQFSALFSIDLYLLDIQFRKEMEARDLGLGTLSTLGAPSALSTLSTSSTVKKNITTKPNTTKPNTPAENFALQRFAYKLKTLDYSELDGCHQKEHAKHADHAEPHPQHLHQSHQSQPQYSESIPKLIGIKRTRTFISEGEVDNNQNKFMKSNQRQCKDKNLNFNNNNFNYSVNTKHSFLPNPYHPYRTKRPKMLKD